MDTNIQAAELADLLDEYARLERDAGFDENSWDAVRRHDGKAKHDDAAEVRLKINSAIAALSQAAPAAQAATFVELPDDGELEAWRQTATDLRGHAPGRGLQTKAAHLLENAYIFARALRDSSSRAAPQAVAAPAAEDALLSQRIDVLGEPPTGPGTAYPLEEIFRAVSATGRIMLTVKVNAPAATCVGCEGQPAPENNPCAVCKLGAPAAESGPVAAWVNLLPGWDDGARRVFTDEKAAAEYHKRCYDLTPVYLAAPTAEKAERPAVEERKLQLVGHIGSQGEILAAPHFKGEQLKQGDEVYVLAHRIGGNHGN